MADLRYTFEERLPNTADLNGSNQLMLFPTPRSVTYYALRVRLENAQGLLNDQYRYFYFFDTRIPGEPLITVDGNAPYNESPQVSISRNNFV